MSPGNISRATGRTKQILVHHLQDNLPLKTFILDGGKCPICKASGISTLDLLRAHVACFHPSVKFQAKQRPSNVFNVSAEAWVTQDPVRQNSTAHSTLPGRRDSLAPGEERYLFYGKLLVRKRLTPAKRKSPPHHLDSQSPHERKTRYARNCIPANASSSQSNVGEPESTSISQSDKDSVSLSHTPVVQNTDLLHTRHSASSNLADKLSARNMSRNIHASIQPYHHIDQANNAGNLHRTLHFSSRRLSNSGKQDAFPPSPLTTASESVQTEASSRPSPAKLFRSNQTDASSRASSVENLDPASLLSTAKTRKVLTTSPQRVPNSSKLYVPFSRSKTRIRKRFEVPQPPQGVTFFSSVTKRPLKAGEYFSDSDEDTTEDWAKLKRHHIIDSLDNISIESREFMKTWNDHFESENLCGDRYFADAFERFVLAHADFLCREDMRSEFMKVSEQLKDGGLIASLPSLQSSFSFAPSTTRKRKIETGPYTCSWATRCICGQDVTDASNAVVCSNPTCSNPEYHIACVGPIVPADIWFCQSCQATEVT